MPINGAVVAGSTLDANAKCYYHRLMTIGTSDYPGNALTVINAKLSGQDAANDRNEWRITEAERLAALNAARADVLADDARDAALVR